MRYEILTLFSILIGWSFREGERWGGESTLNTESKKLASDIPQQLRGCAYFFQAVPPLHLLACYTYFTITCLLYLHLFSGKGLLTYRNGLQEYINNINGMCCWMRLWNNTLHNLSSYFFLTLLLCCRLKQISLIYSQSTGVLITFGLSGRNIYS